MNTEEIRTKMQEGFEFNSISSFSEITGKAKMDIVMDAISNYLQEQAGINSLNSKKVQGHVKLLTFYEEGQELCLIGGQISQFFYTKNKDEGGLLPILGNNFEEKANNFWDCMNPEKGYVDIHFVCWEVSKSEPGYLSDKKPKFHNLNEMYAYRISFRMQTKLSDDKKVLVSFLYLKKEIWEKTF